MFRSLALASVIAAHAHVALAQLNGTVGPTTSFTDKAAVQVCDVTDYGASSSADFGDAFVSAWSNCSAGGLIYIPPGEYPLQSTVEVKNGDDIAIQWDGTVYRDGELEGNMFSFRNCKNFELFSGNSEGAFQGYGWEYLKDETYGARMFRFEEIENMALHGLTLVDSPEYYVSILDCVNVEVYNMLLRGATLLGGTDGFDISGSNFWVHDVEVSNGDKCVTVKSPSSNFLIESIYCNLSGGTAIGSLGEGTDISNISYQNLYMNGADACYLKTNNGDGTVTSVSWDNVYIHGGSYVLAINEAWGEDVGSTGVQLSDLTFKNWYGYNSDSSRPTIRLECDADVPCYNITLENVNLWTEDGDEVEWACANAYGTGACLNTDSDSDDLTTYTTAMTTTTVTGYELPATMTDDFTAPLSPTTSFTIPPMATSFFPGKEPYSTLLSYSAVVSS
ncbi:pectin lyase fold/virulence factor [Aspergillus californicus]